MRVYKPPAGPKGPALRLVSKGPALRLVSKGPALRLVSRGPALLLGLVCLLLFSSSAAAQTFEVSGGYQYINADFTLFNPGVPGGMTSVAVPHGWNAGVTYFVSEDLAVTGQFSVNRGTQLLSSSLGDAEGTLQLLVGGIRFANQAGPLDVGINLGAGWMGTTVESSVERETTSTLAVSVGAFVDLPLGKFGVRLFQGDVVFSSGLRDNPAVRASVGAFYRF